MAIGIFGGTFDPIHIGHLRTGLELREHIGLDELRFIPCGDPPHRDAPLTPARHRLAMTVLALDGEPGLRADDCEVARPGLSYTADTLADIRAGLGEHTPLCLCIGMDSLVHINRWHRWRELAQLAHIVVAARPGWSVPRQGEVADWLDHRQVATPAALTREPAGHLYVAEMTLLPVSATGMRQALASGYSIRYLTPDSVIDYIADNGLYTPRRNHE